MHEVLVSRLGGLSLPRKSVVRLTDRPDMTLDVYRGRKTTMQQQQKLSTQKHRSEDSGYSLEPRLTEYPQSVLGEKVRKYHNFSSEKF